MVGFQEMCLPRVSWNLAQSVSHLKAKARAAGSWRSIPEVDLMWYAKAGGEK